MYVCSQGQRILTVRGAIVHIGPRFEQCQRNTRRRWKDRFSRRMRPNTLSKGPIPDGDSR